MWLWDGTSRTQATAATAWPRCPVPGAALTHPLPGLVLAVLCRHLAKALPGLQLLHGLHGPAVFLTQDVPNLK